MMYRLMVLVFVLLLSNKVSSQNIVDSDYFFNKGYELYSKYKFEDAIYWFDRSVEKKNHIAVSFGYKASCELFQKDIQNGIVDLDSAFHYDSSCAILYYFRSYQYFELTKFDSAIYFGKIAESMSPNDATFIDALATKYMGLKLYDSALIYENKAVKLKPFDNGFLNNLGNIEKALEKFDDALLRFELCVKRHPDDILARTNIAFCKYKLKQYNEAIKICNYVMAFEPKYSYPYLVRGLTYIDMGEKRKACSDFIKLYSFEGMEKVSMEYYNKCSCDK